MVVRVVPLCDAARVGALVEASLREPDRERVHRLGGLLRGERREERRVDAAREEHADGNVGEQVRPHRVAHACAQLLHQLRLVVVAQLGLMHRRGMGVALDAHVAALLPHEQMPCRELAHVAEDRVRRGDGVEGEERLERVEVDLAARQGAHLRRELERAAGCAVVERLDAVAVAREHEPARALVPDRDREHPAQPAREVEAVLLVQVHDRLRVGVRAVRVPVVHELAHELRVVVDLAVLDDDAASVLVEDRLVAAGEVDDRESARRERDGAVDVFAGGVGAAVLERRAHRLQARTVRRPRHSTDPAHRPRTLGGAAARSVGERRSCGLHACRRAR